MVPIQRPALCNGDSIEAYKQLQVIAGFATAFGKRG
jgi:hypothetical protein